MASYMLPFAFSQMVSDELERMADLFERRKRYYDHAIVSLAMNRTDAKPMLLRGTVRFEKGPEKAEERLEYKSLILSRTCVSPDEGLAFAEKLHTDGADDEDEFRMPEKYDQVLRYDQNYGLPLPSDNFIIKNEWPTQVFLLKHQKPMVNDPRGPLLSTLMPIFTNPQWAITKWIGLDAERMNCSEGLAVLLPDYRARIHRIRIGDGRIDVVLDRSLNPRSSVAVKVEAGWNDSAREIQPEMTETGFAFSFEKSESVFQLFILDDSEDEIIDWTQVNTRAVDDNGRVEFTTPSRRVEQLIEEGENQQIEFKCDVGSGDETIESVLSFANTNDGVILVGVNDDGTVVGIDDIARQEERVLNFVDNKCDPPVPSLSFERHKIGDRDVLAIHVKKGDNPPYLQRETGITYLRRNATDRRARRVELERLHDSSSSGIGVR